MLYAQTEQQKFIKAHDLSPGVYFSFEEFKNNKPSIGLDSMLKLLGGVNDKRVSVFNEKNKYANAGLNELEVYNKAKYYLYEQVVKSSDSINSIWGYNDGNDIYVYSEKFSERKNIYKMTFIGRFSIVEQINIVNVEYKKVALTEDQQYRSSADDTPFFLKSSILVISYNSGQIIELNKSILLQILKDDPELKEKYQKDKSDHADLASYIIEYDLRHPLSFNPVSAKVLPPQEEVKW
jgi:hypothetical protein